jgi:hypothetical protein
MMNAPVLHGLDRKAQEITQANRVSGHGQDQSDPGPPGFFLCCHNPLIFRFEQAVARPVGPGAMLGCPPLSGVR